MNLSNSFCRNAPAALSTQFRRHRREAWHQASQPVALPYDDSSGYIKQDACQKSISGALSSDLNDMERSFHPGLVFGPFPEIALDGQKVTLSVTVRQHRRIRGLFNTEFLQAVAQGTETDAE